VNLRRSFSIVTTLNSQVPRARHTSLNRAAEDTGERPELRGWQGEKVECVRRRRAELCGVNRDLSPLREPLAYPEGAAPATLVGVRSLRHLSKVIRAFAGLGLERLASSCAGGR
jgi:hypothetical protein